MTLDYRTTNVGKGLAILAVVGLHILALPERAVLSKETQEWFLIIDQTLRFCVPLFVFLSGYGLAKRYEQGLNLKEFYWTRVFKILPLFFLWTAGTYIISWILKLPFQAPLSDWWKIVFLGQSDYHFYFVPMILQLYLLFPVIRMIITQSKLVGLIVFLVFQIVWFNFMELRGMSDQEQYILMFSWIFYFAFGIYAAVTKIPKFVFVAAVVITPIAGWLVINHTLMAAKVMDPIIATRFTRLSVLIYSTTVILSLAYIIKMIAWVKIEPLLEFIGRKSFLIYLAHTNLLRIVALIYLGFIDRNVLVALGAFCLLVLISRKIK